MHFKYRADGARVAWNWERSLIIKPCDNAATGTTTGNALSPSLPFSLSSTPHILLSFAFSPCKREHGARERERERERENERDREREREREREHLKVEQDGNKEDGYSGPTLTHTSPGLNYTCVSGGSVQMWRESHSSSDPQGRRAGGQAGRQAGRHQGGLGGNAFTWDRHTLHAWRMWDAHTRSLPLTHIQAHTHMQAHTRGSPRINQTFSDDGRPSVAVCGWGLFGRWSQKSNDIVFMQEIKKPPLCTVMEMRGVGRGEMEGE